MRLLADMHMSPRTVRYLRSLGHDVVRVNEVLPPTASDRTIVTRAVAEDRAVLTQDLDLSAIVATSGRAVPPLITLRLSSSDVDAVNDVLRRVLPAIEDDVRAGALITVEDHRVRRRRLPIE